MTTPKAEYLRRKEIVGLQSLTRLHHRVMDRIYFDFSDGFSFDEVLNAVSADSDFAAEPSLSGNRNKVKLLVCRALDGLVLAGMLRVEITGDRRYYRTWSPPT